MDFGRVGGEDFGRVGGDSTVPAQAAYARLLPLLPASATRVCSPEGYVGYIGYVCSPDAGSGWSSYSEVAAYMGGDGTGNPLPILMAGRDFGQIVDRGKARVSGDAAAGGWSLREDDATNVAEETLRKAQSSGTLQQYWPKPFA